MKKFLELISRINYIVGRLCSIEDHLISIEEHRHKDHKEIMATFKDLIEAQKQSAQAILNFIEVEAGEIKDQLASAMAKSADEAASKAFEEAIGSLGSFTDSIGSAIQGMVPGMKTPEVTEVATPGYVQVVEVQDAPTDVELPLVIQETASGVEGGLALDVAIEATVQQ